MARLRKKAGDIGSYCVSPVGAGWRGRVMIRDYAGKAHELDVTAPTEAMVRERIEAKANAIWNGLMRPISPETKVKDLTELWLEEVRAPEEVDDVRQTTVKAYVTGVRTPIIPNIGNMKTSMLNTTARNRLLLALRNASPSKAKEIKSMLPAMPRLAVEHGALPSSPVSERRRVCCPAPRFFTLDDTQLTGLLSLVNEWRRVSPQRNGGALPDSALITDLILVMSAPACSLTRCSPCVHRT